MFRISTIAFILMGAGIVAGCGGDSGNGIYVDFQAADVVLGEPDFDSNDNEAANSRDLSGPFGPAEYVDGKLLVPVYGQSRIAVWNGIPTQNYAPADYVIGQPDLDTAADVTTASGMDGPVGVFSDGTRLLTAEYSNDRVLIYNTIPGSAPGTADLVLGQPDMVSSGGACGAGGMNNPYRAVLTREANPKLLVADANNNRILIWNSIPTTDAQAADVVLGQADMDSCDVNRTGGPGSTPAANTLSFPSGIWTDGLQLFVADSGNHRILVWDSIPTTDGATADWVIGQDDFDSNTSDASIDKFYFDEATLNSDGERLCVADDENNRLLIWNDFPMPGDTRPDVVIGQSDFDHSDDNDDDQDGISDSNPSARTLYAPVACTFVGNKMIVPDYSNDRVLIFSGL